MQIQTTAFTTGFKHSPISQPSAPSEYTHQYRAACSPAPPAKHQWPPGGGFQSCQRPGLIARHQDALEVSSHSRAAFLEIYALGRAVLRETTCLHKPPKTQDVSNAVSLKAAIAHSRARAPKPTRTHAEVPAQLLVCAKNMPQCINTEFKQSLAENEHPSTQNTS